MKSTVTRWLPTLTPRTALVAIAAAALVGTAGAVSASAAAPNATAPAAGTVAAANAAPAPAKAAKAPAKAAKAPAKAAKAKKAAWSAQVKHSFQLQNTFFNCGPSATRVALSAHGKHFTQAQVGRMLGTTEDGTASANEVTRVLNKQLGTNRYHTVEIAGQKVTAKQINQLKADVVTALSHGDVVVANIAGTVADTHGDAHSYEGGHYIPVVGFYDHGNKVTIADSADTVGSPYYNVSVDTLANWIATRGYSA